MGLGGLPVLLNLTRPDRYRSPQPPPSPVVAHFRRGRRPLLLASFLISTFVLALSACWPLSNSLTHRTPVDALDLPVVELPLPIELLDDSRFLVLTVIGRLVVLAPNYLKY